GDEAVAAELAPDGVDRPGDALVASREEADERDVEDAGVELLRPVVLREGAAVGVVPALADLAVDLVADLLPAVEGRLQAVLLGESHRAVEHDPGHDLGVRVVASGSARLPDPVVGLAPDRLDVLDDTSPPGPQRLLDPAEHLGAEEQDRGDLAVDVELELLGGGVADPYRLRALIAGKVRQLVLGQAPLAADPVHDLDLRRVAG